jgi:predicted GTPase
MSNPKEQRADGCSIFFTFIIVTLLSCAFLWVHSILQPDKPEDITAMTDLDRAEKIQSFHKENSAYNLKIEQFHSENNSSLEVFMNKTVTHYNVSANKKD